MKKRNLLLSSVVMMLVSVLALTTSAYAWFVSNATPNIGRIEMSVVESNSLTISGTETGTYAQVLPVGDIVWAAKTVNPTTGKLNPVTLEDGSKATPVSGVAGLTPAQLAFRFMSSAAGEYDGAANLGVATETTDKDYYKNWVQFDVWFRASADLDVYIDIGARLTSNGVADTATTQLTNFGTKETNPDKQEIIETLRMAVTYATYNAAGNSATAHDNLIIYEPNDTNVINGAHTTGGNFDTLRYPGILTTNYYTQSGVLAATPIDADSAGTVTFQGIKLFRIDAQTSAAAPMLVKATFYIWIEGNDPDCTDAAAASSFFADIFFRGVPVVTTP